MRQAAPEAALPKRPVRVLVVDDSLTARALVRRALGSAPDLVICGEAEHPLAARDAIRALDPDVLVLDVEMPGMDGLSFLRRLMAARPMPVIMFSSLTARGSDAALEALRIGAFDCLAKPGPGDPADTLAGLRDLVRAAAVAPPPVPRRTAPGLSGASAGAGYEWGGRYLFLAASTGGVDALETVLGGFPANAPPTVVVQHMPEHFLARFAERLDRQIAPRVRLAADGLALAQGEVALAPGGASHAEIDPRAPVTRPVLRLSQGDKVSGHRPSADVLFASAARLGAGAVGAILTGMGRDGAEGLLAMRRAGAATLGQDAATCVVHGMPRAAGERGALDEEVALGALSARCLALTGRPGGRAASPARAGTTA